MSILKKCSLFAGISEQTLDSIARTLDIQSYGAGMLIFHAGDSAEYLYILEEGRVRLRFSEGGQVAYALSDPGDALGWSSMIDESEYTLTAQSVSAVTVARIHRDLLSTILNDDPRSGLIFYRNLSSFVGNRLFASYKATVFVHGERSSLSYG